MVRMVNMANLLSICLVFFMSCSDRETIVDKDSLLGNDYRLFQETPAWNLAKAVWDENIPEIKRIVQEEKIDVDYQDERFGHTLLMLTVKNQQNKPCEVLLELGANPNKHDTYDGSSAMIDAAEINEIVGDNTEFLKLMLAYGGNPNDEEIGERKQGNSTRYTPLIMACSNVNKVVSPLDKVKLLVDAGANVNYKNEFDATALTTSVLMGHYDVVLYLLNHGADFSQIIIDRSKFSKDGKKMNLADVLREDLLSLDSEKYKLKMQIVAFLKDKGIDYRALPIPDYVMEEAKELYPKTWKEYLEKY